LTTGYENICILAYFPYFKKLKKAYDNTLLSVCVSGYSL
jgi:hypothetical protein